MMTFASLRHHIACPNQLLRLGRFRGFPLLSCQSVELATHARLATMRAYRGENNGSSDRIEADGSRPRKISRADQIRHATYFLLSSLANRRFFIGAISRDVTCRLVCVKATLPRANFIAASEETG